MEVQRKMSNEEPFTKSFDKKDYCEFLIDALGAHQAIIGGQKGTNKFSVSWVITDKDGKSSLACFGVNGLSEDQLIRLTSACRIIKDIYDEYEEANKKNG